MLIRGPLTDRKINEYAKRGWYSSEYKAARRDRMNKQRSKQAVREGSFLRTGNTLIYAP